MRRDAQQRTLLAFLKRVQVGKLAPLAFALLYALIAYDNAEERMDRRDRNAAPEIHALPAERGAPPAQWPATPGVDDQGRIERFIPVRRGTLAVDAAELDRLQQASPAGLDRYFGAGEVLISGRIAGWEQGASDNDVLYLDGSPPIALDIGRLDILDTLAKGEKVELACSGGSLFGGELMLYECGKRWD